jgi:Short C-terminal domain
MKATVTPEIEPAIADIATRHGLSRDGVLAMLFALHAGGGTMAQFCIPELGGSGQWMRGGMTMVGNMFDNALKARVDALCNELAQLMTTTTVFAAPTTASPLGFTANNWWPAGLGVPSSTGGQNDVRYAVFPATRRLAIQFGDVTKVFDTEEHHIGGVQQQQQGRGFGSVTFTSQLGTFDVSRLRELGTRQVAESPAAAPAPQQPAPKPTTTTPGAQYQSQSPTTTTPSAQHQAQTSGAGSTSQQQPDPAPRFAPQPQASAANASGDPAAIVAAIESLAGLHQRGFLSDEEFSAKKAELLGRL